jgi:hypothetical protein
VVRPDGKRQLKNVGLYVTIILKCILKKWGGEAWIGLIWLRAGTGGGHVRMR